MSRKRPRRGDAIRKEVRKREEQFKKSIPCPCGHKAVLARSTEVWRKDYGFIYICRRCGAYVGCHSNSSEPLGTPANVTLRRLRKKCHELFDPLWLRSKNKRKNRKRAYRFLQKVLGVDEERAHIGMLTKEECKKLIKILEESNDRE